jgi:hypothetical protein
MIVSLSRRERESKVVMRRSVEVKVGAREGKRGTRKRLCWCWTSDVKSRDWAEDMGATQGGGHRERSQKRVRSGKWQRWWRSNESRRRKYRNDPAFPLSILLPTILPAFLLAFASLEVKIKRFACPLPSLALCRRRRVDLSFKLPLLPLAQERESGFHPLSASLWAA